MVNLSCHGPFWLDNRDATQMIAKMAFPKFEGCFISLGFRLIAWRGAQSMKCSRRQRLPRAAAIYQPLPTIAVAFHCLFHQFGLVPPAIVNL
jgi:hypothetical protein